MKAMGGRRSMRITRADMTARILGMLIALCVLAGMTALGEAPDATAVPAGEAQVDEAQAQAPSEAPADAEGAEEGEPRPANGYVLVSTATQSGWLPLPDEGEYSYPLKQVLPDGTEAVNVIHLTPEGVYMEDSTCANHDCMEQGMVTLDNKAERILGNMIICLPNQVCLQLYTPEELLEMAKQSGADGGGANP